MFLLEIEIAKANGLDAMQRASARGKRSHRRRELVSHAQLIHHHATLAMVTAHRSSCGVPAYFLRVLCPVGREHVRAVQCSA